MSSEKYVHKILKRIPSFHLWEPGLDFWSEDVGSEDVGLGDPIGLYKNESRSEGDVYFFTKGLLLVRGDEGIAIPFERMMQVFCIENDNFIGITILTKDGLGIDIPISGRRGRFRDYFEVIRFLDRIVSEGGN